jgi:hypothetical protein
MNQGIAILELPAQQLFELLFVRPEYSASIVYRGQRIPYNECKVIDLGVDFKRNVLQVKLLSSHFAVTLPGEVFERCDVYIEEAVNPIFIQLRGEPNADSASQHRP